MSIDSPHPPDNGSKSTPLNKDKIIEHFKKTGKLKIGAEEHEIRIVPSKGGSITISDEKGQEFTELVNRISNVIEGYMEAIQENGGKIEDYFKAGSVLSSKSIKTIDGKNELALKQGGKITKATIDKIQNAFDSIVKFLETKGKKKGEKNPKAEGAGKDAASPSKKPRKKDHKEHEVSPILKKKVSHKSKKTKIPDFERIRGTRWLNDTCIRYAMELLKEKYNGTFNAITPACVEIFLKFHMTIPEKEYTEEDKRVIKSNLIDKVRENESPDFIAFPINVGHNHWTIAVANMREKRIEYYDSLRWDVSEYPLVKKFVKEFLPKQMDIATNSKTGTWKFKNMTPPGTKRQQPGGNHCGVYIIAIMDMILRGNKRSAKGSQEEPAKVQFNFTTWRERLYKDLTEYYHQPPLNAIARNKKKKLNKEDLFRPSSS